MKKLFSLTLVAVAVISGLTGYLLGKPAPHATSAMATRADPP